MSTLLKKKNRLRGFAGPGQTGLFAGFRGVLATF